MKAGSKEVPAENMAPMKSAGRERGGRVYFGDE
jgi:hypothetical protein